MTNKTNTTPCKPGDRVRVNGREFTVETVSDLLPGFMDLRGPRGARYGFTTNIHSGQMFLSRSNTRNPRSELVESFDLV